MAAWYRRNRGSAGSDRSVVDEMHRGEARALRMMAILGLALGLLMANGSVVTATPEGGADGPPEESQLFSIEVHVSACEPGYAGTDFYADCHHRGSPNVTVTLASTDGNVSASDTTEVTADQGPGIATFGELPPGEYVITIDIPGDVADFESYCSADNGDTAVPLVPEDTNQSNATFTAGQAVVCDWYAIPFDQGPPENPENPENPESAEISLEVRACDVEFDSGGAGSADFFAACPELTANVGFILTAESGTERSARTDDAGAVTFADLSRGFYSLGSDVPGHDAEAYLFCAADGGDIYEKDVNDSGFTTFADLNGESIACDWYIVPFDLRGSDSGESPVTPAPTTAPSRVDSDEETVTTLPRTGAGAPAAGDARGWLPLAMALGLLGFTSVALRWGAGRDRPARRPVPTGDPRRTDRT
jgi:hypothetical protein